MNYSPTNEGGLLSLVAALKAGMDPSVGVQMLGMIEQDQAQQVAQRQERLSGLASLISGAAQGGMPYEGASALMEAQPGPVGPAAQNILQSLYPGAEVLDGQTPMQMSAPIDTQGGRGGGVMSEQVARQELPQMQSQFMQSQSPAYQPDPMAEVQLQQAQTDLMQQQQTMAAEPAWGQLQTYLTQAKAKGWDPVTAIQHFSQAGPDNATLLSMDSDRVKAMLTNTFGAQAMALATGVPQG